jgi:phosphoenolpyruvate carboxykinase (ATP)
VTRQIIDAIHAGDLDQAAVETDPIFGLHAVSRVPGVSDRLLIPRQAWDDADAWQAAAKTLAAKLRENFSAYAEAAGPEVVRAGPPG